MRKKIDRKKIYKNRLFVVLMGVTGLFSILLIQFFRLQIVEQEEHEEAIEYSTQRTLTTEGVRGEIFDRYGRPLAQNKAFYTLKIDQQVQMTKKELNESILSVITLLEDNGDAYIDEVPISKKPPFVFTESESKVKLFINTIPFNGTEHRDELLTYTAQELMDYLRSDDIFQIDASYTDEEARKIIAIRHQMFQVAYQKYKPITIAKSISQETLAVIEEQHDQYPNMMTQIESYRYYPYGEAFGNLLGYTRKITSGQLEEMKGLGYNQNDVIGQMGIEQSMQETLRGRDGIEKIEVDNVGKKVRTIQETEAIPGKDVFLTIDANIQLEVYDAIEKQLADAIIQRLTVGGRGVEPVKARELLVSMIKNNQLDLEKMEHAKSSTMQYQVYEKLIGWYTQYQQQEIKEEALKDMGLKQFFVYILEEQPTLITDREMVLMLTEQGTLQLEETQLKKIKEGNMSSLTYALVEALRTGKLKPSQMSIEPYSASAVVVEANTGNVLALVGYPSYDSNKMTLDFNNYYSQIQDGIDERNLLWNRALMTSKAPGSTFKMISAIAGLETGVVNTSTIISDQGVFTKAGSPHPKCWVFTNNGHGHGAVDIHRALEVSCNYYFYELAYRMGLKYGVPFGAINIFSDYAKMFGLDSKTGIELPETPPNISNPHNLVETNIYKALRVIANVTEKGQKVLNNLAEEVLLEGATEKTDKLFERISKSMIEDMKKELTKDLGAISELLTQKVLADDTKRSMKVKTQEVVSQYLESLISKKTHELILEAEDEQDAATLKNRLVNRLVSYLFEGVNLEWTNAINVRTAIGQGNSAFTPVQIARYMAALANGRTLYDLKLVEGVMANEEDSILETTPNKVKGQITVKESTLEAVYEGMHRVTRGREGTARTAFATSKADVVGKTGTAQETGTEHSWFVGFGPYQSPEIAVVTTMYDAKGLGSHNYKLASDIFERILVPEEKKDTEDLGPLFVE